MRIRSAGLILFTAVSLAGPAWAQTADGSYHCTLNGGIPLGIVTVAGESYSFRTTNTAWELNPNPSDGDGFIAYDGPYIIPSSGPLVDSFGVTGAFGDGFINFNNDNGNLFSCAAQ